MDLSYSLNTFYFLISGLLVMWMAAGFTMLEAGSIRSKNVTEILIIKDHFEYSIFSRWVLMFMDFIGNYYNNVNIPKKYFTKNSFDELLVELNLNINEKFLDKRYYSKIFMYLSNPKLHFIYVIS